MAPHTFDWYKLWKYINKKNLKLPLLNHGGFYKSFFLSWTSPCYCKPSPCTRIHLQESHIIHLVKLQNVQTCPLFCKHQSNRRSLRSPCTSSRLFTKSGSVVICFPPPEVEEVLKVATRGQSKPDSLSMTIGAMCMLKSEKVLENKLCQYQTIVEALVSCYALKGCKRTILPARPASIPPSGITYLHSSPLLGLIAFKLRQL